MYIFASMFATVSKECVSNCVQKLWMLVSNRICSCLTVSKNIECLFILPIRVIIVYPSVSKKRIHWPAASPPPCLVTKRR